MRLDVILKHTLKILLCYGTATREFNGIRLSSKRAGSIWISMKSIPWLVPDDVTRNALSKMAVGTSFSTEVFNEGIMMNSRRNPHELRQRLHARYTLSNT